MASPFFNLALVASRGLLGMRAGTTPGESANLFVWAGDPEPDRLACRPQTKAFAQEVPGPDCTVPQHGDWFKG